MIKNFLPSPCAVPPEILAAQAIPPDSPACVSAATAGSRMREYFFPGSETVDFFPYVREGLYRMVLDFFAGKNILLLSNGPLSQEWFEIAQDDGGEKIYLFDCPSELPINLSKLTEIVKSHPFDAAFFVETDVYTGISLDIASLIETIRSVQREIMIVVDCSGSIFSKPFRSMENFVDIYLCGSDMALGLPPGLGMIAMNIRAHTRFMGNTLTPWYFNYARHTINRKENKLTLRAPYPLLNALNQRIDRVLLEGYSCREERMKQNKKKICEWAQRHDFEVVGGAEIRSDNVTVLKLPEPFVSQNLEDYLSQYGISIGNGQREYADHAVVIAHGQDCEEKDMDALLAVLDRFLSEYDTRLIEKTGEKGSR